MRYSRLDQSGSVVLCSTTCCIQNDTDIRGRRVAESGVSGQPLPTLLCHRVAARALAASFPQDDELWQTRSEGVKVIEVSFRVR